MASNIKFKRSAVENRVPTTAQLELGELALNTYDGKLYTEKNSGSASVVEIGSILSSLVVDGANGGGGGDVTFHGTTAGRDLLWDYSGNRLDFKDNVMARFGDTGDLQISHNGTDSIIKDAGVGRLKILGGFQVKNVGDSQTLITANTSGANATNVELYNSNAIRLTTTADGVDISGTGSLKLPVGTTAQRNSSPTAGDMRYNSTTGSFEGYTTGWGELGGSGIGIGSTSVNPGSGVVNPLVGVGFTTINFVGAGLSVTGYGSTVVVDLGGAVSRKYGRKIHAYTATANQTTFAGLSYTNAAAQISVYLNGAKLSAATYTATSGSTVVLGTGASVGDEIEIICIDSGVDLTRNVTSYTATANQTTFTGLGYSDGGDLDVYLNGIRLAQSDYTANNGTSLVLATGASVGDLLEVVDMGQGAQWSSGFGADPDDIYRLNGGVGIGTTNPTDKLNIVGNVEVVGILTATHYGDGSNLSGIDTDKIEEGNSSVEVIDSGSNGKVALTLDGTERYRFTDGSFNLHQSTPIRLTGIAGGTGGGMHLDGTGGNGRIAVFGNSGTLSLLHSTASSDTNMGVFNKTGSVDLYHNGSKKFETAAYGVNVTGTTDTDGLVVSGVTTTSGAATVGGTLTITGNQISGSSKVLLSGGGGSNTTIYSGGTAYSDFIFTTLQGGLSRTIATLDQDGCLNLNRSDGGIVVAGISTFNEKVLIGTATEGHPAGDNLTVADTGNSGITIRSGTSNNGVLYFSDGTSGSDEYRGAVQYNHSENYLRFYTNGDERLRIDSSGNLNVTGITTVGGNLVVAGNLQIDGTTTTVNTATMTVEDKNIEIAKGAANDAAADGAGITVDSGDGDKTWNWVDATNAWTSSEHINVAAGKVFGFADDADTSIDRPSADTIRFTTGNAERFKIDNGGRVSIGDNPTVHTSTLFHVEDTGELNVKFEGNTTTLGARLTLQNNNTAANSFSQYAFNDAGGQSTSAIQGINTDQTNNYGELAFLTRNAQGSPPAERMRIIKDGKIGIGHHQASQITHELTIRPANDGGISIKRPGDTHSSPNTHLNITTTTSGSVFPTAEAYTVKYKTNNSDQIFETYAGGGTGGNISFRTSTSNNQNESLRITPQGSVNIGGDYTQSTYKLKVTGSFAATTKSFVIDHPTKENHQLRYACLEGPENSVYVRGRTKDGTIDLPDYWTGLVDEDSITVNLTPIGNKRVWVESINNNSVNIASDDDIDCFYTVFAERKDVEKLVVEEEK